MAKHCWHKAEFDLNRCCWCNEYHLKTEYHEMDGHGPYHPLLPAMRIDITDDPCKRRP